jgi:hypothetical protein
MGTYSERAKIVDFLKRHVIGSAVSAKPVVTKFDRDEITSIYEEDVVFSNLSESREGFAFDMTTLARGTRYLSGAELRAEGTLNTVRVLRYEITERLSSNALLGFSRFISSTNTQPDPIAGAIFLVRMSMRDGELRVEENQVGYSDRITAEGAARPIAVDGVYTYSVKGETLAIHYDQTTFDVDPVTLSRAKTGEKFPTQVSRQVRFPEPLERIP